MKIGIVTFQHANNYGALLQSYALQTTIKKMGLECEIIAYESQYIQRPYSVRQLKNKGLVAYFIGTMGYICYLPRKKHCNEFRKLIDYSHKYNKDNIVEANEVYDMFIAGSDQVWNYKLTGGDMNFLLEFVEDDNKKNSYAASIGLGEIEPFMQKKYREALTRFRSISVRENRAQEILGELGNIDSQVVVDPTLLIDAAEWERIAQPDESAEEYIVVYQLGISRRFTTYVKELVKRKGLKIKYIPFPLGGLVRSCYMLRIGPSQWLGLFKNAKYVVTDSFHGVVFSLLFHKQFMGEVNERYKNIGSRIYDLLNMVNLGDRLINHQIDADIDAFIDFDSVDHIIQKQRDDSLKYLDTIIKSVAYTK